MIQPHVGYQNVQIVSVVRKTPFSFAGIVVYMEVILMGIIQTSSTKVTHNR